MMMDTAFEMICETDLERDTIWTISFSEKLWMKRVCFKSLGVVRFGTNQIWTI